VSAVRKEGTAGSSSGVSRPSARRPRRNTPDGWDWDRLATEAKNLQMERYGTTHQARAKRLFNRGAPYPAESRLARRRQAAPKHTIDEWAERIRASHAQSVMSVVKTGSDLIDAKNDLGHGQFGIMLRSGKLPFGQRTAEFYMRIAEHPVLSNPNHGSNLPASWRTLAELARLDGPALERAIRDGRVTPELERPKVADVVKEYGPPPPPPASPEPEQEVIDWQDAEVVDAGADPEPDPDPEPEDEPEPVDGEGFMAMPDGSGQVRMHTPEWRRELGPGLIVHEDLADPEVTDLATQLTILVERLRDLPRSKAQSVLKPLEAGLLELLDVLGYEFDQEEVT
jgi:hypothetical protein